VLSAYVPMSVILTFFLKHKKDFRDDIIITPPEATSPLSFLIYRHQSYQHDGHANFLSSP
jgi:hypothetical protein